MKRLAFLTLGLCLATVSAAFMPSAVDVPAPMAQSEVAQTVTLPQAITVDFLLETTTCSADASRVFAPANGYQCPTGVPYCWRAQDCAGYCGGGFEVCEFGCCACAG